MRKGCLQVYTGAGKGKTTAALGLALRSAGAGLRVFMGQFLKFGDYSEIKILRSALPQVTARQYGRNQFVKGIPAPEDTQAALAGLAELKNILRSGAYDVVIADEANNAVAIGLFSIADLLELVAARLPQTELIITGRDACPELLARADLVTEMREIKHPYNAGVPARVGIEF